MSYRHILATVDLESPHAQTIFQAGRLASRLGSQLSVVSVLPDLKTLLSGADVANAAKIDRELRSEARSKLETLCQQHHIQSASCQALTGNPREAIIDYASQRQCDLVAVGTHDRDLGDYFLGTTATAMLHYWMGDVLGVRKRLKKHENTVVVAVDGETSTSAILWRARQVVPANWRVQIVFVADLVRNLDDLTNALHSTQLGTVLSEFEEMKKQQLSEVVEGSGFAADDLVVLRGRPSSQIKKFVASTNARLLIMGSGVHTGVGWLLGSTANRVLNEVACDTLVVRPPSPD